MPRSKIETNLRASAPEPQGTDRIAALQSEIHVLEEAVASQQTKIKKRLEEIQQFEQALLMIQKFPDAEVPSNSPVADIKQLIESQTTLLKARAKEDILRRSLAIARQSLPDERSHLTKLQQELAKKQTDLDWESNYKHLAPKYLSGYKFRSHPAGKPEELLESLESQIAQCEQDVIYWQQHAKKPRFSLPAMADPERSLLSALVRLEQLQKARKKRQTQSIPPNPDPLQDEGFRQHVRHRVAIDSAVGDFMQAQSDYQKALDKFRAIALHHEQALDFRLSQLENPVKVAIVDDKIILKS
ncbi:MAG: hypothetical protein PUP93_01880 [Rhizonema sp. NSF051]|nr:hypothetical protein [Rhizonema sp. NSF051]